jgi:hypothetical protein
VVKADAALVELLHFLRLYGYQFTTVTPKTHAQVLAREATAELGLRDIFGWNRPFSPSQIEPILLQLVDRAGALTENEGGLLASRIRVASLGADLFVHSGFPTRDHDSVFFGPDTYRFVRFVKRKLRNFGAMRRVVDMGAGNGAGGVAVSRLVGDASITLVDVNPAALAMAAVNAASAGVEVELLEADRMPKDIDLIIANPPFLVDKEERQYRHGGSMLGGAIALDWVRQALESLSPGGAMLLYTGAAFVDGRAPLLATLAQECKAAEAHVTFEELDPDVFGEELANEPYRNVERIAAVGLTIRR